MENKYYLLTPRVDFLLIGGLGLLAYFIILIFFNIFGLNLSWQIKLSYWMIILAFFVNSPHFLISYLIFYRENSDKLFKLNRYALVGLYIPIFLFFFTLVGLIKLDDFYFKSLLFLMFFLVGWHYIKQAYGCFIVYSAGNKIYYSKFEQNIIKISLYPLWVFSFFKNFTYESMRDYWGFQYKFPNFLKEFEFLIGYFSIIGVVSLILLFVYNVIFSK